MSKINLDSFRTRFPMSDCQRAADEIETLRAALAEEMPPRKNWVTCPNCKETTDAATLEVLGINADLITGADTINFNCPECAQPGAAFVFTK